MTNPTTELEHVIELLKKATTGPWRVGVGGYLFGEKYAVFTTDNDAAAIAAAVNFIREHGHTLLEAMRDAERLERGRSRRHAPAHARPWTDADAAGGSTMKVTAAMIGAAHDVTMKEAGIILSHELIAKIYEAMQAQAAKDRRISHAVGKLLAAGYEVTTWRIE